MFYTYAHYTPQGRLFYIGKGSGEYRANSLKGRNKYWHRVVAKYGKPKVQILATWDTNKEALDHEIILISCFKDMGYKLCNMTDGGEGSLGTIPWNKGIPCNKETKAKISLANKGNTQWVGRKHSAETIKKQMILKTQFKFIGTNINTGEVISIIGKKAMGNAGFTAQHIYNCANGKEKCHKGYTWSKELLGNK
jgi:hypothetical protein